jgi:hypothetical protein
MTYVKFITEDRMPGNKYLYEVIFYEHIETQHHLGVGKEKKVMC